MSLKQHQVRKSDGRQRGFTLLELLVVVALIVVLTALLLPTLQRTTHRAKMVTCSMNLRQIGLAFRDFKDQHDGMLPTGVPLSEGGVKEFFFVPGYPNPGYSNHFYRVFQSLSNSLGNPRVLVCPSDRKRRGQQATLFQELSRLNVSYYSAVALPGRLDDPNAVWAGDAFNPNILESPGKRFPDERVVAYTTWGLHADIGSLGNLLYADGRVERFGSEALPTGASQVVYRPPTGSGSGDDGGGIRPSTGGDASAPGIVPTGGGVSGEGMSASATAAARNRMAAAVAATNAQRFQPAMTARSNVVMPRPAWIAQKERTGEAISPAKPTSEPSDANTALTNAAEFVLTKTIKPSGQPLKEEASMAPEPPVATAVPPVVPPSARSYVLYYLLWCLCVCLGVVCLIRYFSRRPAQPDDAGSD